jgi:nucleotide-binding universal stress UspA family protein
MTSSPSSPTINRIVHATDFDPDSEASFHHALKLAVAARSGLHLIHVDSHRQPTPNWRLFPHVRHTLSRWGLLEDEAAEDAVAGRLGVKVSKAEFPAKAPAEALADYLEKHPSDLLVLGHHANDGLSRLFSPSVSEPMARRSGLPVLFVPIDGRGFVDGRTGAAHLRNVVIPVDRSPDPSGAIQIALNLAGLVGEQTRFHLLHVGAADGAPDVGRFADDPRFQVCCRSGPVVETILAFAHEAGADLIVMTTHGHDGFLDALRGSTTEQVLRKAGRALVAAPAV